MQPSVAILRQGSFTHLLLDVNNQARPVHVVAVARNDNLVESEDVLPVHLLAPPLHPCVVVGPLPPITEQLREEETLRQAKRRAKRSEAKRDAFQIRLE